MVVVITELRNVVVVITELLPPSENYQLLDLLMDLLPWKISVVLNNALECAA